MAGALVNVLLQRLATITIEKVGEGFKLVAGVEEEVNSLASNLEAIQAVLEDAEKRQVTEANVRRWLTELTQVSNDMDNVLDEWITRVRKRQMEKQEKHALATTEKVLSFASSFFSGSKVTRLVHRRDIAGRIKELNKRLAFINKEKQSFHFQTTIRVSERPAERSEPPVGRRETTSLPNVKTFGRDEERSVLVNKLLSGSSQDVGVPLIIPIVGMGGMGKTTLAQLAYNDENVKSHFDKRIWVCVSDPFEEIKIAQAIIEEIDKDNSSKSSNVLQTLTQCIYELIKDKKFLLVLDDVWSPEYTQWEELIKAFRSGAVGSRILVTTRKKEVASLMKATTQLIPMKYLGVTFCLSLFYYSANIDESNLSKEFRDIGLELVKRCNGLPLAAKTLGSLMGNKKNIHEWRDVLNSKIWELEKIQEDVFRPLLLSYHDLDSAIKHCLLYCVLFPKDYIYDMNTLIELWMAQDYLNAKGGKERIPVGQNYFDDLVRRSFFQDVKIDDKNTNITCKLHDIVHDFLQYLTKNEYLILDLEQGVSERNEESNEKVHHLNLVHTNENASFHFLLNYKKLRTFISTYLFGNSFGPILQVIVQLKCLRTINLCYLDLEEELVIPKIIGGLIHLRYLDLSYNENLRELPDTIGNLYNLQSLRLVGNKNLRELPDTMGNLCNLQTLRLVGCRRLNKVDVGRLINLRHLFVKGCGAQGSIKGIEKLRDLQRLDEFVVRDGDERNKFEHLKDLNQLQGSLTIQIWGCGLMAEKANMVNKDNLLQLTLDFPWTMVGYNGGEIMNGLEPHQGLEKLTISGYTGGALSHWLSSLHNLRVLTLKGCGKCEVLPSLGKLPSLESLVIRGFGSLMKVGVELLGIDAVTFPKLKQLTVKDMQSWEEWEGVETSEDNTTIMPCLSELTIHRCDRLKALPDFLWKTPLHKLMISKSQILEDLYREETGEEWAKISHIPIIDFSDL